MTQKHKITICICTYKRPELLKRLLSKLETQKTEDLFDYSIVIVDNDKHKSAYKTVSDYISQSQIAISYDVEPEQNIALARNKAITNAKGDYFAFIDDDEFPNEQWLLNLYKAINHHKADGILGPVLPHFETEPPRWVLKGKFFDRPTHPTGAILDWTNTRTGNVLLKKDIFIRKFDRFDPKFGSGGEDRDFFRRMIEQGHTFLWSNEAPVFETIPSNRWNRKFMIKRALLRGKMALNATKSKPLSMIYSLAAVIIYSFCLPFLLFSHHVFMKYLIKLCDHIGKVAAFFGINLVNEKYVGA